jgi:bifunctional DNA-binding transcriptional regulator/antitoxin component of YhaV-PrlF toxin-antitoxin module
MTTRFEYKTALIKGTQNGIFAEFPFDSFVEFGSRKPIPVKVTIDGHFVQMNLLPCGNNHHWLHVRKEIRIAIGKDEGDMVEITVEKDDFPKTVNIPDYLQWLLENDSDMMKAFVKMPNSAKKFWVEGIDEIKNEQPKVDRINRFFEFLKQNYSG